MRVVVDAVHHSSTLVDHRHLGTGRRVVGPYGGNCRRMPFIRPWRYLPPGHGRFVNRPYDVTITASFSSVWALHEAPVCTVAVIEMVSLDNGVCDDFVGRDDLPQGHWLHQPLVPRGVSLARRAVARRQVIETVSLVAGGGRCRSPFIHPCRSSSPGYGPPGRRPLRGNWACCRLFWRGGCRYRAAGAS